MTDKEKVDRLASAILQAKYDARSAGDLESSHTGNVILGHVHDKARRMAENMRRDGWIHRDELETQNDT